jgi:hypothetical protein
MPGDIANDNNANGGVSYYLVAQDGPQGEVCDSCCKGPDSDDQWPFDMQQIANKYADMMGNVKEVDTVVLVADTGLDLSDPTVNRTLWTDTRVVRKLEKKYGENPHGTNLSDLKRGGIDISPEYPFAVHGTEVVKTLTGGPSVPETFPAPFKVAIAKVIRDSGPFDINADAVANMFMYASYIDARRKVLNFSVVIGSEEASLIRGMDSANFLVVSAAGNKNRLVQEVRRPRFSWTRI